MNSSILVLIHSVRFSYSFNVAGSNQLVLLYIPDNKCIFGHKVTLFYWSQVYLGPIYGSGSLKVRDLYADLTDVTLADGDTKSILTDRAIGQ